MIWGPFAAIPGGAQDDGDPRQPAPEPGPGLAYEPRISGAAGDLRDTIEASANLFRLRDKPPASLPALRARLDADLDVIETVLKSEGYYGFRIEHRIDARREPVAVEIDVTPGEAYRLVSYEIHYIDGAAAPGLPTDPAAIGVTLGEPARAETIVEAQSGLIRLLGDRGYPYATAEDRQVVVHHDERSVTVTLDVRPGPPVDFGAVEVAGNERVEQPYILRLADLHGGKPFSLSAVDNARRRLFESGLFDSVTVTWPQQYAGEPQVPVSIDVRERDRRTIAAGLFYSTTEGAGVDLSWAHRNMFGQGERLELGTRLAERETSAYADFLKPNVGRLDQHITGRSDLRSLQTDAYDQNSFATALGAQRKLGPRWKASLSAAVEATEIQERDLPEQRYLIFGLPGKLDYDGSDDLFDPSRGMRLTFDAAPTQVTGDSSANFLLGSVTGSAYQEVWGDKRVILAERVRLASLVGAEREDIPASRRLYAGGGGSVRGYAYQSAGPLDDRNRPLGGRSLLEVGFEARVRITENFGIVPFIDGGTVYEDPWPSGDTLQWAAGLGFRYYTPIGPLRFDIATPLNRREGVDDAFAIYISLGQAF